jgi:hypothetical protein
MMIYEKPIYYTLFHILIGFLSYDYPILFWGFLIYQGLQYVLNVRFFVIEWKIAQENSWQHTALKVGEFFVGYLGRAWHQT